MLPHANRVATAWLCIGIITSLNCGIGCYSVSAPGGDNLTNLDLGLTGSSVTARGASVTTRLREGGQFNLTRSVPQRNILDVQLFTEVPADSPCSGEVILDAADVSISVRSGASRVHVTVRVMIDAAGSPDPCERGTQIGSFEITMISGQVQTSSGRLQLSGSALRDVLSNDFGLCLEAEGDFDGTVTISRLVYTFSVSECSGDPDPDPDECILSPQCEYLHEQYAQVADEWLQVYYSSGAQQVSNDLMCRYYSLWVQINDLDCFCPDEDDEDLAYLDGLLAMGVEQMRDYVNSACQPPCPSLNDQMAEIAQEMSDLIGAGGELSDSDRPLYDALYCDYAGLQIQAFEEGCFDYSYTPEQVQQSINAYEQQLEDCP